jgi:GT2 family glycosyltransferase
MYQNLDFPLISILILNWNRPEKTVLSIKSAQCQTYENFEIVLIDNGSTDNSIDIIQSAFPDLQIIQLNKNYGCPEGRNIGINYCSGDYIFYIDNDGILHKDSLLNAFQTFQIDENVAVITGLALDYENYSTINQNFNSKKSQPYYFSNFSGGISLHKKEIYKITGVFPSHFIYGAEELYLSLKIIDAGYKILKNENVILWHKKEVDRNQLITKTINSYFNKLYTAIVLFPLRNMFLFVIYFTIIYFFHAYKSKILFKYSKLFLSRYFSTLLMGLKHRNPVKINTYKYFQKNRIHTNI